MATYSQKIRQELHMYPEIGFDLKKTLALIKRELEDIGVEYTEKYGKSSIVATINGEKKNFTLAIRADMDALPIEEKNEVAYKSKNAGVMHACGHDAHVAIALNTIRKIYPNRDKIPYRVKFIFQSAEEYTTSGAKLMVDDGVMEEIDFIAALHCDPTVEVGKIAVSPGVQNAMSIGFYLNFFGKSSHVARQEMGADAIMMAVKAYTDIEFIIAKCFSATDPVIFNVGKISGGNTNNIIADRASMFCTFRTISEESARLAIDMIRNIAKTSAESLGGKAEMVMVKEYPMVRNDEAFTDCIRSCGEEVLGKENVLDRTFDMLGEDFSYFSLKKPGCMFRLGVKNAKKGILSPLHSDTFDVDEDALEIGSEIFERLIMKKANEL